MFFNILGITGSLMVLYAYFLLQKGTFNEKNVKYILLNLLGSLFIIASLLKDFNLPSFLIESVWAVISFYFLVKNFCINKK